MTTKKGNPGNDVELKEDDISHGHSGGQPLSEDSGNATKLKKSADSKNKSGLWSCCFGGSTASGYPSEDRESLSLSENHENAINENLENDIKLKAGDVTPQMGGEDGSSSLEKSGGSLRSQSGTPKEGSVGHGKSGGPQGSGQNGIQINENIYESPSLSEYPGAGSQGSQGSGQNGSQTNANIYHLVDGSNKLLFGDMYVLPNVLPKGRR